MRAAIAQIVIKEVSGEWGSRYEGQVNQDGDRHGKGVWSCSDGYSESGKWENNSFLG